MPLLELRLIIITTVTISHLTWEYDSNVPFSAVGKKQYTTIMKMSLYWYLILISFLKRFWVIPVVAKHCQDSEVASQTTQVRHCWWYWLAIPCPNEKRRCRVKTALTFLLVYTLRWQVLRMGLNKGWEEEEETERWPLQSLPSSPSSVPLLYLTTPLESLRLGLNEGPGGIVGTLPQRALGCWDWPREAKGKKSECVCVSGFCLCYWRSCLKVKHPGRVGTVRMFVKVIFSTVFVEACFVLSQGLSLCVRSGMAFNEKYFPYFLYMQ